MSAPEPEELPPASGRAREAPPRGLELASTGERRLFDSVLTVGCALWTCFMLGQILTFSYGRDQGIYAMVARAVLDGEMPYRDAWDFKPPGVFVVYAISRAAFGSSQFGIRLTEVLGLVAMGAAMIRLARLWWGAPRVGWIAATLAITVHAELDFWHTAQPESFGGMLTIFALLACGDCVHRTDARDRRSLRGWIVAGALFGFAGLLKPPLAGGGAVLAAALAWNLRTQRAPLSEMLRPVIAIVIGAVLPIAACVCWFAAKGALSDLCQVLFVFTPHYTALSWQGQTVPGMLYWGFTEWLAGYSSLTTVGLLLFLTLGNTSAKAASSDQDGPPRAVTSDLPGLRDPAVLLIASLIALHIVGVTMQGKFFPYHYGATWPLTAMLAALGYERVYRAAASRGPTWVVLSFVGTAFVGLLRTATKDLPETFRERCLERVSLFLERPRDQIAIDELASVADVNAVANRAVADWIDSKTSPSERVLVFGFEPVIYDLADRDPATRYLYDVPQRVAWAKRDSRAVLMADLAKTPPSVIVVEHRDVFPAVTGESLDSAATLGEFPELGELIARDYELVQQIEDFDLYREVKP